jgi:hydrogenase nickel incorporation protein HypB
MSAIRVPVVEKIFSANDRIANQNKTLMADNNVYAINIMASPGAGKTSFILQTIKRLQSEFMIGVIEGDTAPVTIDSDKVIAAGMPAVQINTGGDCHLDAVMMSEGLTQLPLADLDVVIVENVGNLICPAAFDLGTNINLLIASVPEGDDKPYKYPNIYRGLDVLIINKIDLEPYVQFDMEYFTRGVQLLNPGLTTFQVSCRTEEGFTPWIDWLRAKILKAKQG